MNDAEAAMARTERLFHRSAIPASDYDKDRYAFLAAKATFAKAEGRAGADPGRDLEGRHRGRPGRRSSSPRARWTSIKTNLERLIIRAPMDGEILQLNVRLGQLPP